MILKSMFRATALAAVTAAAFALAAPASAQSPTGTLSISGKVKEHCYINIPSGTVVIPADTLVPGQTTGAVALTTITQVCNKHAGFTLTADSANCGGSDVARLLYDSTPDEYIEYTLRADGVAKPMGSGCTPATINDISSAKGTFSTVVTGVFTVPSDATAAVDFVDTLTLQLTTK